MIYRKNKHNKAFTLIELLIVIAVISLLSSIVFNSLNSSRGKARDALRVSQIKEISNAVELYYSDYGFYPNTACDSRPTYEAAGCWHAGGSFYDALVPSYISTLPLDPLNEGGSGYMCSVCGEYIYNVMNSGRSYILSTYLETNLSQKTGIQWNNYVEVPGVMSPPFSHSGSNLYGPFFSLGSGCTIIDFWTCI